MKHLALVCLLLLTSCTSGPLLTTGGTKTVAAPDPLDGGKTEFSQTEDATSTPVPMGYAPRSSVVVNYYAAATTQPGSLPPIQIPAITFPAPPAPLAATTRHVVTTGRAVSPQNTDQSAEVSPRGAKAGTSFPPGGGAHAVIEPRNGSHVLILALYAVCFGCIVVGAISLLLKFFGKALSGWLPGLGVIIAWLPILPLWTSAGLIVGGGIGVYFIDLLGMWIFIGAGVALAGYLIEMKLNHKTLTTPSPTQTTTAATSTVTSTSSTVTPAAKIG